LALRRAVLLLARTQKVKEVEKKKPVRQAPNPLGHTGFLAQSGKKVQAYWRVEPPTFRML